MTSNAIVLHDEPGASLTATVYKRHDGDKEWLRVVATNDNESRAVLLTRQQATDLAGFILHWTAETPQGFIDLQMQPDTRRARRVNFDNGPTDP